MTYSQRRQNKADGGALALGGPLILLHSLLFSSSSYRLFCVKLRTEKDDNDPF
ncbi:unnamed protein product [Prunus brigantina]